MNHSEKSQRARKKLLIAQIQLALAIVFVGAILYFNFTLYLPQKWKMCTQQYEGRFSQITCFTSR